MEKELTEERESRHMLELQQAMIETDVCLFFSNGGWHFLCASS